MSWNKDGDRTRARLIEVIRAKPGIDLTDLATEAGFAWSTVDHHVRVLQRSKYIHVERSGRESYLFPQEIEAAQHGWFRVLRDEGTLKVFRHILDTPCISGPDIGRLTGFSEKVMRRHLGDLHETGLTLRRGEGRPVFEANPDALARLPALLRLRLDDAMPPSPPEPMRVKP